MNTGQSIIEQVTGLYLKEETGARVYDVRAGHRTVFTDIFQDVTAVTVDGEPAEYTPRMWDNRNATVFNSIVLDEQPCPGKELSVTAEWIIPDDLADLISKLDAVIAASRHTRVKSKKNEDFSVTFNDNTDVQQFLLDNAEVIARYSLKHVSQVQSGVLYDRRGWYGDAR